MAAYTFLDFGDEMPHSVARLASALDEKKERRTGATRRGVRMVKKKSKIDDQILWGLKQVYDGESWSLHATCGHDCCVRACPRHISIVSQSLPWISLCHQCWAVHIAWISHYIRWYVDEIVFFFMIFRNVFMSRLQLLLGSKLHMRK